ncbi:hypothetical protein CBER1_07139 [Cercospora berteroae]|uniref:Uncharacterized protein n=1 Tax=Cercospora berteroae TaxID=357750 RepID=A0A2S6CFP5_9PEZI|nr:hypothetical protein CBER1_07139 [Cercospora berteroae]
MSGVEAAHETVKDIKSRALGRQHPERQVTLVAALSAYQDAHDRLMNLINTDAQENLSSVELFRLDSLCKSSLALCSMLYADSDQLFRARGKRSVRNASIDSMIGMIWTMTDRMNLECAVLEESLEQHSFDDELRDSSVYRDRSKPPPSMSSTEELEDFFAQDPYSQSSASSGTKLSQDSVSTDAFSALFPDAISITSTFEAGAEGLADDPYADMVEKAVVVNMEDGHSKQFTALLDTGATINCIAETDALLLRTETNTRKLPQPKPIKLANDEYIEVTHVMKCIWQFPGGTKPYTHIFHIVPGLPRSLVICRQVIFQHGFLIENIELCSLGLPKELKAAPELYVLGMAAQTKAKKEEQSQQAKAAMKANEAQRRQELEDMKQAFARRAAAAASCSSNASASTQPSGSSSTQS